ncbi:MAG: hypothetical protein RJB15_882 [Pseudomonadota bacterium]
MIERADREGFWQSVTGSLDSPSEDLSVAATREVFEETGIAVDQLPAGSLRNMHHHIGYAPGVTRNTEHWFSLEVPDGIQIQLAPREHVAYEWLPFEEAAKRCFSRSNGEAIMRLFSAEQSRSE